LQKLNRRDVSDTNVAGCSQASDFKLMHPGKKSWKSPYRNERLTR